MTTVKITQVTLKLPSESKGFKLVATFAKTPGPLKFIAAGHAFLPYNIKCIVSSNF